MQRRFSGLRNKLMIGCALIAACVLAAPAAVAHDGYDRHAGSSDADLLGALVVGAVIGGVLVSATQHHRDYGYYYPAQAYAPVGYYGYSAPYYSAPYYRTPYYGSPYYGHSYYGGGYYPRGYGSNVSLNIYSGRGYSHGYDRHDRYAPWHGDNGHHDYNGHDGYSQGNSTHGGYYKRTGSSYYVRSGN